ncbi:hypothetical protein [Natrinema soli]|uniref:C2H2-type domain-containing protein n=1 Tax=Natrinema soli TaxID=1930624 RepID=A0ABD5SMW8_9EURY|nr:hypothetical protein [Natrinema soli]
MNIQRLKRFLEFFVIGIVFGVTEDVLAVVIATDAAVTPDVIGIVVIIAIPFAVLSELVVDHPRFLHFDRLALRIRSGLSRGGSTDDALPPRMYSDGRRDRLFSPTHHHHRCNICGDDYETGALLREHVERSHSSVDVTWWIVAESPESVPRFPHD